MPIDMYTGRYDFDLNQKINIIKSLINQDIETIIENENTIIVDPAGINFMKGDVPLTGAGGLSGVIYKKLNITSISGDITKFYKQINIDKIYKNDNIDISFYNNKIIHSIGPDFNNDKIQKYFTLDNIFINVFINIYKNIYSKIPGDNNYNIILCALSTGIFAKNYSNLVKILESIAYAYIYIYGN